MARLSHKPRIALRAFAAKQRSYSTSEAAAVTGVPLVAINHYISRELAPLGVAVWGDGKRSLSYDGLIALRMAKDYPKSLAAGSRLHIIQQALKSPRKKHLALDDGKVVVRVDTARRAVAEGLNQLLSAESAITTDARTLNGEPCFKGTRIPVFVVAGIAREVSVADAKLAYPKLTKAQIELACFYSRANPRRGRPKRVGSILSKRKPTKSKTISVEID